MKQIDITRAIRAARAAGLTVAEFVATKDGVRVITSQGKAASSLDDGRNPWDRVLNDAAQE